MECSLTGELIDMTDHLMEGSEVSDDTLLIEELDRIGPGGQLLDTKETRKRFRGFWFPTLLKRKTRQPWLEAGGTTLGERLTIKVLKIVKQHRAKPLDPDKRQKAQEILAQAPG